MIGSNILFTFLPWRVSKRFPLLVLASSVKEKEKTESVNRIVLIKRENFFSKLIRWNLVRSIDGSSSNFSRIVGPIRFLLNIFPILISNWLLNYSLIGFQATYQVSPSTRETRIRFDVSPENFNRIFPREFNAILEGVVVNLRKFSSLRSFDQATEKDLGSQIRDGRGWSLWIPTIGRHLRTVGRTILETAARATRTAIVPRSNL